MLGVRLAEVRKYHGDTQEAFANKMSVSVHTVRSWEQGKSSPSVETLADICRLYKVSADYLLDVKDRDSGRSKDPSFMLNEEELQFLQYTEKFLISQKKQKNNKK